MRKKTQRYVRALELIESIDEANACAHQLVGVLLAVSLWGLLTRPKLWREIKRQAHRAWELGHQHQQEELKSA